MPIVKMPDGAQVQFPDEMPPDQIRSLILQKFPQVAPQGTAAGDSMNDTIMQATGGIDPAAASDLSSGVAKAISNVPGSAAKFAADMVQPIIHPIETAENIGHIGKGVLQKFGIVGGNDSEKYADAVGQFFKDRYGSAENIKKTLQDDPVGALADLSTVLTAGGAAAARVPGVVGKVGEAARAAGGAVNPLRPVGAVAKLAGNVAAEVVGMPTGVGGKALKEAAAAGAAGGQKSSDFLEAIGGAASRDPVADAAAALRTMRQERGAEYVNQMAKVGADTTVLDFKKIDAAAAKVSGVKNYKGQDTSPKTAEVRGEILDAINDWKQLDPKEFHTAEGLDALKQKIGDIRDGTEHGSPSRVVASQIYQGVRQTIIDQAPEYAKIMKGYEEASSVIKEIEKTLSLSPNANIDTSLRKLQSVLRNNVNANYGRRAELADYLVSAGATNLVTKLAGQSLNAWTPRGLGPVFSGIANLDLPGAAKLAVLPLSSPKISGLGAYGLGVGSRFAAPAATASFQTGRIGQ